MIGSDTLLLSSLLVFFFLLLDLLFNSSVPIILLLDGRPFLQTINGFFTVGSTLELLHCGNNVFTFSISKVNISLKAVYKFEAAVGFYVTNRCTFCNNRVSIQYIDDLNYH